MRVIKRDGTAVPFDPMKIEKAIKNANMSVESSQTAKDTLIDKIIDTIEKCGKKKISVEQIQNMIEVELMKAKKFELVKNYIIYREKRAIIRNSNTTDKSIQELLDGNSEYWNTENSNKNSKLVTTQRDYIAGITSTDIAKRIIFSEDVIRAHENGIIHIHDMDYAIQPINNCCLINLEDMLQNGTVINNMLIEKPHRFLTACTIATQIILGVSSSQYGGCSISLTHLAPFVRDSYNKFYAKYEDYGLSKEECEKLAKLDLKKEVEDGVQTFNYQINSMTNTNGQSPFLSLFMYLGETDEYKKELAMIIEEFLKQRIKGMKNEKGVYITQAFPKLIYVLEKDNIDEKSKYWYLTELCAKCTVRRLVPDYISEKIMKEIKVNKWKQGDCFPVMGCRSALSADHIEGNPANAKNYDENKPKYYGRFNLGVCTINLPDVALSSKGDKAEFWKLLDERTELCHTALKTRYKKMENMPSDIAPLLWQHGAFARLEKGEKIGKLFYGHYATISLGYAGLYECVKYMTGKSHTDAEGKMFGLTVMRRLNDKCKKWMKEENIDYSIYGSPIESTTYKFAKKLKERFGIIEGITDRDFITNSSHIPVFEPIDIFSKIQIESEFQRLSPGGIVGYGEIPNLIKNPKAILEVIKFIYKNIMYYEFNTKSDYCMKCEYNGEMQIDDDMEWYCPNCGNRDHDKLYVVRRTCGYIGTNFWNKGRTQEIKERYLHLDNKDYEE